MRVDRRIQYGEFDYAKSYPIILQANHEFTKLIFRNEYRRLEHYVVEQLLSSGRDHYWLIRGKSQCKAIIRVRIICFKNKSMPIEQLMKNLP